MIEKEEKVEQVLLSDESKLLDEESVHFLQSALPPQHASQFVWTLLYSSARDGQSIRTFFNQVTLHGPSFIVVKDTNGFIFGGFADQHWIKQLSFYGGENCFLFTLHPQRRVYKASSRSNENKMYFNCGLPSYSPHWNGLGMGGRMKYFSFSLNDDFASGTSNANTVTYGGSPCLASETNFGVVAIEVWGFPLDKKAEDAIRNRERVQNLIQTKARKVDISDLAADLSVLNHAGVQIGNHTNYIEKKIEEAKK